MLPSARNERKSYANAFGGPGLKSILCAPGTVHRLTPAPRVHSEQVEGQAGDPL